MLKIRVVKAMLRVTAAAAISLLVAFSALAQTVRYVHTDGLGSVVLKTDKERNIIERGEYEPYGSLLNRPLTDGPGYTGHVMDSATGLTYMQQRYYEADIGVFLSVDPIAVNTSTGWNFCRYCYAANNPYKFKDPDGRIVDTIADIGFIAYDTYQLVKEPSWTNAAALGADVVGAAIPFATGLGTGVRAAAHGAEALRGADKANDAARATEATISSSDAAVDAGRAAPDFIVSPGGTAYPVPKGAEGPVAVVNPGGRQTGTAFIGGAGGKNGQVSTIRIMDATPPKGSSPGYPNGYIKYENSAKQGVDPYSGKTIPNSQSHYPIDP